MNDRYLDNIDGRRSRTGCIILLALLAIVAVVILFLRLRSPSSDVPQIESGDVVAQPAEVDSRPVSRPAVVPINDPGLRLLEEAREAQARADLLAAREAGWRVLEESVNEAARQAAEQLLAEVNIRLVMEPWPLPEKIDYTIRSGDTLAVLARRHNTTVDLLQRSNRIQGHVIRVGDRIRILQGEFSVEVNKTRNDLVLRLNDRFFKRYRVGTGEFQRTPVGDFKITDRIAQPTWWRQDGKAVPYGTTNNVLGTHWLSIDVPGYGIHGTWEPESIGYQMSAGCVRMLNEEVEEIYTLLPVGVRVVITE
jgi:lipoprotein-anchoring transpeptidase ErfK/SrfK